VSADFSEKLWSKTNDVKQKQCGLMGLILCHDCFSEKTVRKKVTPVVFYLQLFHLQPQVPRVKVHQTQ